MTFIAPNYPAVHEAIVSYEAAHPGRTLPLAEVLAALPASSRESFTLVRRSRSSQGASDAAPRVLLFGEEAQTVFAFNGEAQQAGYLRLEIASVDPHSDELEFRVLTWPSDDGLGSVAFSPANPPACMSCHGGGPHYIWGAYPVWPGTYGSQDDVLGAKSGEAAAFASWRAAAPRHPRYRSLVFAEPHAEAPYRPPLGHQHRPPRYNPGVEYRPNERLGMLLMRWQARVSATHLARSSDFSLYKYDLIYTLAGCPELDHRSALDYAQKLGVAAYSEWQLALPSLLPEPVFSEYQDGLVGFRAALFTALWPHVGGGEDDFFQPTAIAPMASVYPGMQDGPRGEQQWQHIDHVSPIQPGIAGSTGLNKYLERLGQPYPGKEAVASVCARLAGPHEP